MTITDLIGRKRSDPDVAAFVGSLGVCRGNDTFGGLSIADYPPLGVCLYFDEEQVLVTVFLYSEDYEDHSRYRGALPCGTSFSDSRSNVRKRLGEPERSDTNWDRFSFVGHFVHFQYSADDCVQLVTVMAPQMKEEQNQAPLPTSVSVTPAAVAPGAPPTDAAGL